MFALDFSWRFKEAFRKQQIASIQSIPRTVFPGIRCMSRKPRKHWSINIVVLGCYPTAGRFRPSVNRLGYECYLINLDWNYIHPADRQASTLVLIRTNLASLD